MKEKGIITSVLMLSSYIEEHIHEPLNLEQLSDISYISKYHLTRLFKDVTHLSLIEYVQGRKLTRSLEDLLNTDSRILAIANKYGYEYEQTYIRAFKKLFGITPSKWRKKTLPIRIIERITINNISYIKSDLKPKPQIMVKPQFMITGLKEVMPSSTNQKHIVSNKGDINFFSYKNLYHLPCPHIRINLTKYILDDDTKVNYMPGYLVNTTKSTMPVDTVPMMKYAVFSYLPQSSSDLSIKDLSTLYHYIFNEWKYKSGYQLLPYHFEEFTMTTHSEIHEIRIFIPIGHQLLLNYAKNHENS